MVNPDGRYAYGKHLYGKGYVKVKKQLNQKIKELRENKCYRYFIRYRWRRILVYIIIFVLFITGLFFMRLAVKKFKQNIQEFGLETKADKVKYFLVTLSDIFIGGLMIPTTICFAFGAGLFMMGIIFLLMIVFNMEL
ncbi:hypothetical protein [Bacillus manliponensis]|uniref:hypothetical protein n=1 Tax=Bacillus manliponensis TaxID=574376 RepID=UPI003512A698